jgi:hypothetical protein
MSNPTPTPNSSTQATDAASPDRPTPSAEASTPTPLRCITGALISGGIATLLYRLTLSIMETFANKPPSGNYIAVNIAVAVRTLVMGIFAIAAVGLVALGIQLLVQRLRQPST